MYRIVRKEALRPIVTLYEIEAPLVAKKAQPGQFIILRVDENGERIPITINDYKMAIRIAQAKKMLKNTKKNISEIADSCGFESLQYF